MIINERLIQSRKEKGLIQQDMATYLRIGRTTYVKYETGDIQPPVDMLNDIAKYLDVSIDYLLGNSDYPQNEKPLTRSEELTDKEEILIDAWRQASPEMRAALFAFAESVKNLDINRDMFSKG